MKPELYVSWCWLFERTLYSNALKCLFWNDFFSKKKFVMITRNAVNNKAWLFAFFPGTFYPLFWFVLLLPPFPFQKEQLLDWAITYYHLLFATEWLKFRYLQIQNGPVWPDILNTGGNFYPVKPCWFSMIILQSVNIWNNQVNYWTHKQIVFSPR